MSQYSEGRALYFSEGIGVSSNVRDEGVYERTDLSSLPGRATCAVGLKRLGYVPPDRLVEERDPMHSARRLRTRL